MSKYYINVVAVLQVLCGNVATMLWCKICPQCCGNEFWQCCIRLNQSQCCRNVATTLDVSWEAKPHSQLGLSQDNSIIQDHATGRSYIPWCDQGETRRHFVWSDLTKCLWIHTKENISQLHGIFLSYQKCYCVPLHAEYSNILIIFYW